MRIFLAILILIFNFQFLALANNIEDFEMEGISIGDSLLKHLSVEKIKTGKKFIYPSSNRFYQLNFWNLKNFKTYEHLTVLLKSNDKNYIIYEFSGYIDFDQDINNCYKKEKQVIKDIKNILPNIKFENFGKKNKSIDKSGKSKITISQFYPNNGGTIKVSCHDWSNEWENKGEIDSLSVSVASEEAFNWFINEAYK